MTLNESIKLDMDSVEGTGLHKFIDHLYHNALRWEDKSPKQNIYDQIKEWFNITPGIYGHPAETVLPQDEDVFVDAMLRGKTCCAAFYLNRLLSREKAHYCKFFQKKLNLLIWATVEEARRSAERHNEEPNVIGELFKVLEEELGDDSGPIRKGSEKFYEYFKKDKLTDEMVNDAVKTLIFDLMFTKIEKYMPCPDTCESPIEKSSPTDDPDDEKVVLKEGEPTPETLKEVASIPEGTTEIKPEYYYEKMYEVLHHIAELSTVTNGGHTGCTHDPASWAEEFMRNVTALFSFDLTRHIRPDNCRNKFDKMSDAIVKRFDDRACDNTVLANIGSVLQIIKMLACVRRDNVQDHPTPHGYEYVIDYNKYWSMIKQLYGIDLSDTPKYTNDHRYHLMAALKGAAD